jgi:hypothetical protein
MEWKIFYLKPDPVQPVEDGRISTCRAFWPQDVKSFGLFLDLAPLLLTDLLFDPIRRWKGVYLAYSLTQSRLKKV